MIAPEIYWLPRVPTGRLAVMPRPRGDDWLSDEVTGWQRAGLNVVISLLEADEARELGLADEAALCRAAGIEWISFPIPDREAPASVRDVAALVEHLFSRLAAGASVGIHCFAGIGRSALIAGCVLLRLGLPKQEIFPLISGARRLSVPDTPAQVEWLSMFAQEMKHVR